MAAIFLNFELHRTQYIRDEVSTTSNIRRRADTQNLPCMRRISLPLHIIA